MYCERCHRLFEGDACPDCGKRKHVREPRPEDPCFLVERSQPFSGMLEEVLRRNDIPYLTSGRLGAGLAARVGSMLESSRFYVRCDDYERAEQIVEELFGADEPTPDA